VEGIIEEAKNIESKIPLISVLRPRDDRLFFEDYAKDYPHIFEFAPKSQSYWEAAHLLSISEADVILVIGGAKGTYIAGLAAILAGKKLIPIGSFGGAGEKLSELFENRVDSSAKDYLRQLRGPWTAHTLKIVMDMLQPKISKNIFIVHGHDESMKQSVARTLEALELKPIILHEQANKGRTIIEKFETYSDVSFAIVLLSPDDFGYAKGESPENARPRARQNVLLELGFFIGKLGRESVCVIYRKEDNFEIPSDYLGILFLPYDNEGAWTLGLGKELKACGYNININNIIIKNMPHSAL